MRGAAGVAFGLRSRTSRLISAGLIGAAIGAGASVTAAQAQEQIILSTDPGQREALRDYIRRGIDRKYAEAMEYYQRRGGWCGSYYNVAASQNFMHPYGSDESLKVTARIFRTYLSPRDREEIIAYNRAVLQKLPRDCPPKTAVPATTAATAQTTVAISGGASQARVPQIKGGTQFDPGSGTEIPIVSSDGTITGGNFRLSINVPTPQNVLWGDYFYVSGGGSWFEGSANGSVPIGATGVAQTYIFPNPESGSTGILAGATGQDVRIDSDGHVIDISMGLKDVTPLGGSIVPPGPGDAPVFYVIDLSTTAGLRYRNLHVSHSTDQQSLTFPDLNSRIELDQDSNFIGAQFGLGFTTSPPGSQPGFVAGIDAFVAPGVLFTSATAHQISNCGPCGGASPEFNVQLQRDFSSSHFSVIVGGSVNVGYRFNPNTELSLSGTVEHMTGVPFFDVPTTPIQQPISLGRDSVTNLAIFASLKIAFGAPPPPPL